MRYNLRDSKGRFIKKDSISTIKKEGEYWVDQNGNKWYTKWYSKEGAENCSATLINCTNCINCADCEYCGGCGDCCDCRNCNGCDVCNNCRSCIDCRTCNNCSSCIDCRNCKNCSKCSGCNGCSAFSKNPERITGPKMGSRNASPTVYWVKTGKEQCIIGCFKGTLDELEKAVEKKHKNNPKYLTQYRKFIKAVRAYQGMMK